MNLGREYWHARLGEAMRALRAADYDRTIDLINTSAVAKFLQDEIAYSCLREFLNSLPENDPRRKEYAVILPENRRQKPDPSGLSSKIL